MTNQELAALIKKNPISVGCGLVCLAVGVGIYLRGDSFPAAEAALKEKSELGEKHQANIKNSAQLQEQYDVLVAANKEVESRIVRASQQGVNNGFFYKLASDTGITIKEFR